MDINMSLCTSQGLMGLEWQGKPAYGPVADSLVQKDMIPLVQPITDHADRHIQVCTGDHDLTSVLYFAGWLQFELKG